MGMTSSLYSVTEEYADALRAEPDLAVGLLDPDDPDRGEVAETDLDKAWHGIHYLLTGTAWEGEAPLNFLLHGGVALGEEDGEEAPPRLFDAAEVRAIDAALGALDADALRARYDPQAMQALDIYPDIWGRGEEELDYCLHYFGELRSFMAEAARAGRGVVVFIG